MPILFWSALAVSFLALAVAALIESRRVGRKEHPLAGMPHILIPTPVVRALRGILLVEFVGFILAAAAALYETFGG